MSWPADRAGRSSQMCWRQRAFMAEVPRCAAFAIQFAHSCSTLTMPPGRSCASREMASRSTFPPPTCCAFVLILIDRKRVVGSGTIGSVVPSVPLPAIIDLSFRSRLCWQIGKLCGILRCRTRCGPAVGPGPALLPTGNRAMKRLLLAATLAAAAIILVPGQSRAVGIHPDCAHGFPWWQAKCLNKFAWIHMNGPLYNYGPYNCSVPGYVWRPYPPAAYHHQYIPA